MSLNPTECPSGDFIVYSPRVFMVCVTLSLKPFALGRLCPDGSRWASSVAACTEHRTSGQEVGGVRSSPRCCHV